MLVITSDSLKGYGLNRIFQLVKEAGFDGLDLVIDPRDFDTQDADYIKVLIEEYNLPVVSLSTPLNGNPKTILKAVAMAKKLDVKVLIIQPPRLLHFSYIKWLTTQIPKIRQREEISIALENAPSDMFLGIIPEHAMGSLNELRKFKHAALDTTRIAQKKEDLIRVFRLLRKYLVHVHLSNVKKGKGYALPADGILPLESFLTKLKQEGYRGAISFKIHPKFIKVGDLEAVRKNLGKCKKFYEEYFVEISPLSVEEENE